MRVFLRTWGLLALLAGSFSFAENDPPNILFIITDDLGYGDLGVTYQDSRNFAGNRDQPAFDTPVLDTLASEGIRFTRHYSGSPVCAPARASLLTGRHQGHATVRDNQFDEALEDTETVATVLQSAGYATAAIGKWGLGGSPAASYPAHPLARGFDFFFGIMAHRDAHSHYFTEFNISLHDGYDLVQAGYDKCYSTDLFTARAKKWISDHHTSFPNQPFMMYLAYTAPHARLQVPTQAYPSGGGEAGGMQWLGTSGEMISTASGTIDSWIHPDFASATWDDDGNVGTAEVSWPDYAKRHATMVRRLDSAVGDLQQLLDDLGILENTVIIFTSDNGPHHEAGYNGTYTQDPRFFDSFGPLDGTKRDLWEGGWRVPTLLSWPAGISAPSVITRPSQFHDWLPTFAKLAGVEPPAKSDGVSLLPEITGQGTQAPGIQYAEYTTSSGLNSTKSYSEFDPSHRGVTRGHMQALYLEGFKGVRYNVSGVDDRFRVYETDANAKETVNLSGDLSVPGQQEYVNATLWVRRPHATIPRAYDTVEIPATDADYIAPSVQVFPGTYAWVPRVSAAPARTVASMPGTAVLQADESAALQFEGLLNVPVSGTYTFYLRTDRGAVLRLHDMLLLDADKGYTAGDEVTSGTIDLQAGRHPLRVYSHHRGASPYLELEWEGPGLSRQAIPASAFSEADLNRAPELEISSPLGPVRIAPDLGLKIEGAILDDGLPEGEVLSVAWSVLQTPVGGTAVLDPVDQIDTTVMFDIPGLYQLQCQVSDGELFTTRVVEIRYGDAVGQVPQNASLWYPLSTDLDDHAGDNDGVGTGEYTYAGGAREGGIHFADAVAYVDSSASVALPASGSWSASVWFRLETLSAVNGMLLQQLDGSGTGRSWLYVLQDNGTLRLATFLGGSSTQGGEVELDRWHHAAVVVSGGSLRLYLDGEEVAQSTRTLEANTGKFRLGNYKTATADRQWMGSMEDLAVYARALSESEIAQLALASVNRAPDILLNLPEEVVGFQSFELSASATDDHTSVSLLTYAWSALPVGKVSFADSALESSSVEVAGSGNFRVRMAVGDGSAISFAEGDLSVVTPGDVWRRQYFGDDANAGEAADGADPNANGIPNLFERAFGGHPTDSGTVMSPAYITVEETGVAYVGMEFLRLPGGVWLNESEYQYQDLIYRIRGGSNVWEHASWPVLPLREISAGPAGNTPVTEEIRLRTTRALGPLDHFFLRLEVVPLD